ncbi:MAG: PspC domain-containing protein [Candidatus Diapherotrites archaeon]|nr:PspC domain-containing protein [Candidatus Diapherotrites archaeon]
MTNKRLYRNQNDTILGGVASGMAEYFDTDPTLIRILWVIFGLVSLGTAIILYLAMWIIVPEKPMATPKKKTKKK